MRMRSWLMAAAMTTALCTAVNAPSMASAHGVYTTITIDMAALQEAAAENIARAQNSIDPGTLALLAAGLGAIGIIRRRREGVQNAEPA